MSEENAKASETAEAADAEEKKATSWFDGDGDEEPDVSFKEYDITASPNDFNTKTIVDFVNSGAVRIPGFQRNYVWDIKRASKLIESLLIGLPIPQIFLYEERRNSFLVVDGQQRLMSIYYFVKGRFPRREKRPVLRRILDEQTVLPASIMADDQYFEKFNLSLRTKDGRPASRFHGKNYQTLEDYQTSLDLRTIRNVVIKQTAPDEERDSSVFEIFNRLNTGGVNLRAQEIRSSFYHSDFIQMLHRVNVNPVWRRLTGLIDPDLHEKDAEILLRVIALVGDGESYKEPMSGFLNTFARKARKLSTEQIEFLEELFSAFFAKADSLTPQDFEVAGSGRFNIAVFEAVFRAACTDAFAEKNLAGVHELSKDRLQSLKQDPDFVGATRYGVGRTAFVNHRYQRAKAILQPA